MFGRGRSPVSWEESLRLARATPPICQENRRQAEILGPELQEVQQVFFQEGLELCMASAYLLEGMWCALQGSWDPDARYGRASVWDVAVLSLEVASSKYATANQPLLSDACLKAGFSAAERNKDEVMTLAQHAIKSLGLVVDELVSRQPGKDDYIEFLNYAIDSKRMDRRMEGQLMLMAYQAPH